MSRFKKCSKRLMRYRPNTKLSLNSCLKLRRASSLKTQNFLKQLRLVRQQLIKKLKRLRRKKSS
jgi:hypothetical protein